jgi:hypothetical protein
MSKRDTTGDWAERRAAKGHKGSRLTRASGSLEGDPGDIEVGDFLIEHKSTVKFSIRLLLDWLLKIASEARARGKKPALQITFCTGDGRPRRNGQWLLVPKYVWDELTEDE